MKRIGLLLTLLLIIVAVLTPSALAAGVQWTLAWQYNGALEESVLIPGRMLADNPGMQNQLIEQGWKKVKEGDSTLFARSFEGWRTYEIKPDALPLTASKVDYMVFTMVEIHPAPEKLANNQLLQTLDKNKDVEIIISMPGDIQESSGNAINEKAISFRPGELANPSFTSKTLVYSSWFQWFEMGIAVLILGTLGIMLYLMFRMRKVDRLIEEEYSLEKVEEMIMGEGEKQKEDEEEKE